MTDESALADEQWAAIMAGLTHEARDLYEQANEVYNLKYIASIAGSRAALDELMGTLKMIGDATRKAKEKVVCAGVDYGYSDTHIAERTGLRPRTVRRWREDYEKWQAEQELSTAEVDRLTQRVTPVPHWED